MEGITPEDMMKLQTDNYNVFAETARPLLLKYIPAGKLNENEKKYLDTVANWSLYNNIDLRGPTLFTLWFDNLKKQVWDDEFEKAGVSDLLPSDPTLIEALLRDSAFRYIDNISTPSTETLADVMLASFKKTAANADSLMPKTNLPGVLLRILLFIIC